MSQTYDLRDQIEQLESLTGDGTELVTVTVPNGKSLGSIRERIAQEYASAENIKSDQTQDHVQQALKRVQRILRRYERTPETGLVVYAGIVDGDLISTAFDDLPTPVAESTYRCDDLFDLTPLIEAVTPDETFGLIVIERGGAAIGRLVGERIIPIRTFESQVMGKSRAGGQSAQRFERDRERQTHEFFQQVGDIATDAFTGDEGTVTGLVVGGTLATAKRFVSDGYLDHRLRNRLLGTYSVEYATVQGLDQLVKKADEQLLDAEQREGRKRLDEFYSRLRDGELVAYGAEEVERATEFGAVESVLIASTVPRNQREELKTAVEQQGGDGYVISGDTEHGSQFVNAFSGVGALLRFPVK
jgi:peptide chain release factor subunit 1